MKKILKQILKVIPDKLYIDLFYWKTYHRFPHLRNPKTFDEKIQWYKLYYRIPLLTQLADKFEVRKYIQIKGLVNILNELYGVYDRVDDIDLSKLPDRFVLKATHGSGMNIICKDKRNMDWNSARQMMRRWLITNHYDFGREWAYKNIQPRIICEKYLENEEFNELIDYKFYCFHNKPEVLFVCTGRYSKEGVRYNAYDMNWNRIYTFKGKPATELLITKPDSFQAMIEVARELCRGFPFVRVDLYSLRDKIIFGEITFYPDSGVVAFTPDSYNYFFGDLFVLPDKKTSPH